MIIRVKLYRDPWTLARTTRLTARACLVLETRLSVKCAPFESDAEYFACLSVDFGTCKVEAIKLELEMTEGRSTRQEEHSDDGTAQQETPNPMDSIMKELVQMRKENKKLHRRLDTIFDAKAKKSLYCKRKRPSVDPTCSVSTEYTYPKLI